MNENAILVVETLSRIQKELRCGVCCSTYTDPVITTCQHSFCRQCLESCFEKKRKLHCPICRTVLDKRSCKDSYQLTFAVQNYLKLSEVFKKSIAISETQTFAAIPSELAFCESQKPMDVTIIPENDGKRVAPDFIIPALPTRRKRSSKPPPPLATIENLPGPGPSTEVPPEPKKPEKVAQKPEEPSISKKTIGTLAKKVEITSDDLLELNIEEQIGRLRETNANLDEIDALFKLMPTLKKFLEKNFQKLSKKLGQEKENDANLTKPSSTTNERRVTFGKIQPDPYQIPPPLLSPEKPLRSEDDEIVADSDEEDQTINVTTVSVESRKSRPSDVDRTTEAVQSEQDRIDFDLSQFPKIIACSRIANDKHEELLSDFHAKFLSNSCRFSDDVTAQTTHLVMMNSEGRSIPQKSLLYAFAVARGCIIVSRDWMVDCVKMSTLISETDYTITSCPPTLSSCIEQENKKENEVLGWHKSRQVYASTDKPKLLTGYKFMIIRRFASSPYVDYRKLIELVKICGGQIFENFGSEVPKNLIVVFSKTSPSIGEFEKMEKLYRCPVVTIEWLLDSVSEYSMLPYSDYLIKNVLKSS